ncbi:hypothetical protein GEMRC1_010565 [Eukaryota sp. GEM-RC1]
MNIPTSYTIDLDQKYDYSEEEFADLAKESYAMLEHFVELIENWIEFWVPLLEDFKTILQGFGDAVQLESDCDDCINFLTEPLSESSATIGSELFRIKDFVLEEFNPEEEQWRSYGTVKDLYQKITIVATPLKQLLSGLSHVLTKIQGLPVEELKEIKDNDVISDFNDSGELFRMVENNLYEILNDLRSAVQNVRYTPGDYNFSLHHVDKLFTCLIEEISQEESSTLKDTLQLISDGICNYDQNDLIHYQFLPTISCCVSYIHSATITGCCLFNQFHTLIDRIIEQLKCKYGDQIQFFNNHHNTEPNLFIFDFAEFLDDYLESVHNLNGNLSKKLISVFHRIVPLRFKKRTDILQFAQEILSAYIRFPESVSQLPTIYEENSNLWFHGTTRESADSLRLSKNVNQSQRNELNLPDERCIYLYKSYDDALGHALSKFPGHSIEILAFDIDQSFLSGDDIVFFNRSNSTDYLHTVSFYLYERLAVDSRVKNSQVLIGPFIKNNKILSPDTLHHTLCFDSEQMCVKLDRLDDLFSRLIEEQT